MKDELPVIFALKKVLESAGSGDGIAHSLVVELRRMVPEGSAVARMILLGNPLPVSLRPLAESKSGEISMLSTLIGSASRSSTAMVGRSGRAFAAVLERWVRLRENVKLEMKVQAFRSLVTSGVLGAVTAMLASLGPLVANLNFIEGSAPQPAGSLLLAAGCMTAISSGMLGFYMSGRRFILNVMVAMLVFGFVSAVVSPLVDIPSVALWGIK